MQIGSRWGIWTVGIVFLSLFLYVTYTLKPTLLLLIFTQLERTRLKHWNHASVGLSDKTMTPKVKFFISKTHQQGQVILRGPRAICNCSTHSGNGNHSKEPLKKSHCSDEASILGPGQKVISYSVFTPSFMKYKGKHARQQQEARSRLYIDGLSCNIDAMRMHYPGWVMRVYTNMRPQQLCPYACAKDVFICDVRRIPVYGDITRKNAKIWRFLPLGDPTVSMFAVRDSDSRLSLREKAAVNEWINSTMPFHTMRDHPQHRAPIMAGLWGGNNDIIGHRVAQRLMNRILKVISQFDYNNYNADQWVLNSIIYKNYRNSILIHDSYLCKKFQEQHRVPFPVKRRHDFLFGTVEMDTDVVGMDAPCPRTAENELLRTMARNCHISKCYGEKRRAQLLLWQSSGSITVFRKTDSNVLLSLQGSHLVLWNAGQSMESSGRLARMYRVLAFEGQCADALTLAAVLQIVYL